ncbi:MAG: helicase-exonuclease AddAB subunit AddA [Ruminococcaceae bacterium]|nr:helicase-exonuclease AddAB subunit AddA [Oscillospiraceae bacterium]
MADKKWTDAQRSFIDAKRGPILVSAAAGSGKTSAIVERVAQRLSDALDPLSPERLLMTTFSNAAANEMLSRIEAKLSEKADEEPENELLQRQFENIGEAQIGTIHSFCLKIIRENFSRLDLSCDFRIADEAENEILMLSAADRVIKNAYAENDKAFYDLVENVCSSKNDYELLQIIIKVYNAVVAMPFPLDVLDLWTSKLEPTEENYLKLLEPIIQHSLKTVRYATKVCEKNIEDIADEKMSAFILEDISELKNAEEYLLAGDIPKAFESCLLLKFSNRGYSKKIDPECKELVISCRKKIKKMIENVAAALCDISFEKYQSEQTFLKPIILKLFELVRAFMEEFASEKRAKNLVDFSDAEQFMLKLLWQKENGEYNKTALASALSSRFDEIYIDEYQDVNAAQEMIFKAISTPQSNVFMVGDVKQSIYGFRHADADIFEEKKEAFFDFDSKNFPAKIFFDNNFRSRKSVTDFINNVFFSIMIDGVGAGAYSQSDSLKASAQFEQTAGEGVSLLFYETPKGTREKYWLEKEAVIIAKEIERLVNSGYMISENGSMRPCRYGDFCILARSGKDRFSAYYEALKNLNIDAVLDKSGGDFLESREMLMVLSLLKAINNPYDDVSLCAALISPVFLFTPQDLAEIRADNKKEELYISVKKAAEAGNKKCIRFLEGLEHLRNLSAAQSVDGLLSVLYNRYGIYHLVGAMSGGEDRMNNLDIFRFYARQFEANGYKGLSQFLKFIEKTRKNNSKLSGAQGLNENRNAVSIMTVHKSKGLEFPICILANSLKNFNTSDSTDTTLINKKTGFSCRINDLEKSVRYSPVSYKAGKASIEAAQIAEEMRLLYVAMTRAKEKLIIPIVRTSIDDFVLDAVINRRVDKNAATVLNMNNWAQWIMYSCANSSELKRAFSELVIDGYSAENQNFNVMFAPDPEEIKEQEKSRTAKANEQIVSAVKGLSEFNYPYAAQTRLSSKFSVSELTKGQGEVYDFESKPDFMHSQQMTGAQRGTALHTFMQFADYKKAIENINAELDRMVNEGFVTEHQRSVIDEDKLSGFFASSMCKRILSADAVLREYKFMTGVDSSQFGGAAAANDTVILQGVADCVIIEGDKATVIDYKTDYVKDESELLERYSMQLAMYRGAIEKLIGLPVKECLIYSFCLGKEIAVKTPDKVF